MVKDNQRPVCGGCGDTIVGAIPKKVDGVPYCRECAYLEDSAQLAANEIETVSTGVMDKPGSRNWFPLVLILAAAIVIALRIPAITKAMSDGQPRRTGTYETDRSTDQCINNLWTASRSLQTGDEVDSIITCPASQKHYITTKTDLDTEISCPNPDMHKLTALYVSKLNPVPRIFK